VQSLERSIHEIDPYPVDKLYNVKLCAVDKLGQCKYYPCITLSTLHPTGEMTHSNIIM